MVTPNPTAQSGGDKAIEDLLLELASGGPPAAGSPSQPASTVEFPSEPVSGRDSPQLSALEEAAYEDRLRERNVDEMLSDLAYEIDTQHLAMMETWEEESRLGPRNARALLDEAIYETEGIIPTRENNMVEEALYLENVAPTRENSVVEEALYEETVNLLTVGKDHAPDIPGPSTEAIASGAAGLVVGKGKPKTQSQLKAGRRAALNQENQKLRGEIKRLGLEPELPGVDIYPQETKTARRLVWENARFRRQIARETEKRRREKAGEPPVGAVTTVSEPIEAAPLDTDGDGVPISEDSQLLHDDTSAGSGSSIPDNEPIYAAQLDIDGDGVPDEEDRQPVTDFSSGDEDHDGLLDIQDPQPVIPRDSVLLRRDTDGDAVPDDVDTGPIQAARLDVDADGIPDQQDSRPLVSGGGGDRLNLSSPLDREGAYSQAPPVDLSNAPPPAPPPKLGIPSGGRGGTKGSSSAGMPLVSGDLSRLVKQGKADRKKGRGSRQ